MPMQAQWGGGDIATTHSQPRCWKGVGGKQHAAAALPPGRNLYPWYKRLGGLRGRSGWARKISPPQGFDPRAVQPVASRYTDNAILSARIHPYPTNFIPFCLITLQIFGEVGDHIGQSTVCTAS